MPEQYRAKHEHWADIEAWVEAASNASTDHCVLELRDRVEALELGGLEQAESQRFCVDAIVRRLEKLEADAAMTGKLQARPADSLLVRVAAAIADNDAPVDLWHDDARAALLVIADEVERRGDKGLDLDPGETADWLRREASPANQEDYE
jgi:hypothetical protein